MSTNDTPKYLGQIELRHLDCKVLITDHQITNDEYRKDGCCESWKLELGKNLIYTSNKTKHIFKSNNIKEFVFEISPLGTNSDAYLMGIAYVIEVSQPQPTELFRLGLSENKMPLLSDSKTFELTNTILKKLSEYYQKPYSYKLSVTSDKKTNRLIIIVFVWLFALFMLYKYIL